MVQFNKLAEGYYDHSNGPGRYVARSEGAAKAKEILEKKIEDGRKSALAIWERVNKEVPDDQIAKGKALRFGTRQMMSGTQDDAHAIDAPQLVMGVGDRGLTIHDNALGQLAQRAGVPATYARDLASGAEWQRKLLAGILNEHYHQGNGDARYLVRSYAGQARGVMSDKFRRLDSRPLMAAAMEAFVALGAVPIDGVGSDTRVAIRCLLPQVFEPIEGEMIAFGFEWGNSDYGRGANVGRAFILRPWCLNGAVMENALAQVHLGKRLTDDVEFSEKTYRLDTEASVSALRDVIAGTLAPKKVAQLCEAIGAAHAKQVDWRSLKGPLAKRLLKGELEKVKESFEGNDVHNLPAGATMWRASNAVSWLAGHVEDADRKLDLQRLAGELVDGRKDREIAEAA
ncbi:MAG: hypothetical protein IT381_05075 [Deltaproteobacteria bacterium]|nr:hypothetical protein [Deltaproteobacteria bacterium]